MSKKNKTLAKCPKCDLNAILTDDHIIPKWLTQRLDMFGFSIIIIGNKQKICQPCNSKKAGKIDYKDPGVKEFMREFIEQIKKQIK